MTFAARFIGLAYGTIRYLVNKSVRLRGAASAYMTYTPAAGSGNTKAAFSLWIKRGQLGTVQNLLNVGSNSSDYHALFFDANDQLLLFYVVGGVTTYGFTLSRKFRDPAAHLHIVVVIDSSQVTPSDRLKVWVNGAQETSGSFTYYALNTNIFFFNSGLHSIGRFPTTGNYFDGLISEVVGLQNQTGISAANFGESDASGNWTAKRYSGSYGTNGFYLPFNDGSNLTNLCLDRSGNGNHWTASGVSLTAGAAYDWMDDTPTNNYAVMNTLNKVAGNWAVTDCGLRVGSSNTPSGESVFSTIAFSTGKVYAEFTPVSMNSAYAVGVCPVTVRPNQGFYIQPGAVAYYLFDGTKFVNGVNSAYAAAVDSGVVVGVCVDRVGGTVEFFANGVSQGTISLSMVGDYVFAIGDGSGLAVDFFCNFGQRPFAYTPPSGFKALHTGNLPDPVIQQPSKHVLARLRTGGGAPDSVSGLPLAPELIWVKGRSAATNHQLFDKVRGAFKSLASNSSAAEQDLGIAGIRSFNPDGYTMGNNTAINTNNVAYVDWLWKAGGAPVANNAGSIASQVSADVEAGFSIVKYAGTLSTAGYVTIGHGLGRSRVFSMSKSLNVAGADSGSWFVQHPDFTANKFLQLNATSGLLDSVGAGGGTLPLPTVDAISRTYNSGGAVTGNNYIAYCWAEVPGYSRFGSYTGNGSGDGPFVHCGFIPRFVMIKRTDGAGNWQIIDTARGTVNAITNLMLYPNSPSTEGGSGYSFDIVSNGFKIRDSGTDYNASGGTYIFAAFAEAPFKYANAR